MHLGFGPVSVVTDTSIVKSPHFEHLQQPSCLLMILILRLSTTTTTSCTMYLRSFAIWLFYCSYVVRNLIVRPCVTEALPFPCVFRNVDVEML